MRKCLSSRRVAQDKMLSVFCSGRDDIIDIVLFEGASYVSFNDGGVSVLYPNIEGPYPVWSHFDGKDAREVLSRIRE